MLLSADISIAEAATFKVDTSALALIVGPVAVLAALALILGGSVYLSAARMNWKWSGIVGILGTSLWVIPALVGVGVIAVRSGHLDLDMAKAVRQAWHAPRTAPEVLLQVRQQSSDPPAWATADEPRPGDEIRIQTSPFVEELDARRDLTDRLSSEINSRLRVSLGLGHDWKVPTALIDEYAVQDIVSHDFDKDFGEGKPTRMHTLYARAAVTEDFRTRAVAAWRSHIAEWRLLHLAGGVGLVTVALFSVGSALQLNQVTGGRYKVRLSAAVVAAILASGLAAVGLA